MVKNYTAASKELKNNIIIKHQVHMYKNTKHTNIP